MSITTKLIIAGLIVSAAIGLYARHSYLISTLEAAREANRKLSEQIEKSEAEAQKARNLLTTERNLNSLMIKESERITNVLTIEKNIIRTVKAECLDTPMPDDLIKLFGPNSQGDGVSDTSRNAGQGMQTAGNHR